MVRENRGGTAVAIAATCGPERPGWLNTEEFNRRLADLDQDIDRAADRLMRSADDLTDVLGPKLSVMKRERDRVKADLQESSERSRPSGLAAEAREAANQLWRLADELHKAKPARLRELVRRMVAGVELSFDQIPQGKLGKRIASQFSHGTIELRPDPLFSGLVCRDGGI